MVPATKRPAYFKLTHPSIWVPVSKYWRPLEPRVVIVGIPYHAVAMWGWEPDPNLGSGERFVLIMKAPLVNDMVERLSVEEVSPGNRAIDPYLFDD